MRYRSRAAIGASATCLLLGFSGAAHGAEPAYVGMWSKTSVHCSTGQNRPGAPMLVTASGFRQYHLECTFAKVDATSPGVWNIAATCTWNGTPTRMEMTWAVSGSAGDAGGGAALTLTDAAGTHVLNKCVVPPKPAATP
ncbi:MAG: hypothetical protein ACK4MF_07825 [Hyphomicrobiaceae bacterium]